MSSQTGEHDSRRRNTATFGASSGGGIMGESTDSNQSNGHNFDSLATSTTSCQETATSHQLGSLHTSHNTSQNTNMPSMNNSDALTNHFNHDHNNSNGSVNSKIVSPLLPHASQKTAQPTPTKNPSPTISVSAPDLAPKHENSYNSPSSPFSENSSASKKTVPASHAFSSPSNVSQNSNVSQESSYAPPPLQQENTLQHFHHQQHQQPQMTIQPPPTSSFDEDQRSEHNSNAGTDSTGISGGQNDEADPLWSAILELVKEARSKKNNDSSSAAAASANASIISSAVASPLLTQNSLHQQQSDETTFSNNNSFGNGGVMASASKEPSDVNMMSAASGGGVGINGVRSLKNDTKQTLLADVKAQYDSLFSNLDLKSSRALVIADPHQSKIYFANEAAQRLFGRLDLVGSNLESLMTPDIGDRHAGIIASYEERYESEYKRSSTVTDSRLLDIVKPRRLPVIRKLNGRDHVIHIEGWVRSIRLKDETLEKPPSLFALEAFEATEYQEDSEQARISRSVLKNVSDAVVIADLDGRIEWCNAATELLAGYPLSALKATRASVNIFLPPQISHQQHEGYLANFRRQRHVTAGTLTAESQETVLKARPVQMKTAFGLESVLVRVDVAYNKLIGYIKSTKEFIPREEFENERLKLLLPACIVKLLRGENDQDITTHYWEFDNKTVLFTDIVGFSSWAKNRSVKAVHDKMQPMFSEFEDIISAFGGELIHRIGDAVMAIFGFNGEERHHARYALACSCELQQWALQNGFLVRIGLNSGSLGCGIYGSSKGRPGFDAWGPVVNIAKRLEAYGEPGQVHISKATADALGRKFAGAIHQFMRSKTMEGVKGVTEGEETFIVPVKAEDSTQIILPEKFQQLVGFQRARYARWKIQADETERRLAELQKGNR